jgi:N-glycosylase/DNA lyase
MNQEKLFIKKISKIKQEMSGNCKRNLKGFRKDSFAEKERFNELCFCILVAGSSLEQTKKAWQENKKYFLNLDEDDLRDKLRDSGCRFNHRAAYIVEARESIKNIDFSEKDPFVLREKLEKKIKGLGMKEASHFLRNIGYGCFAILDTHVLKTLKGNKLIVDSQKNPTKKRYLEIEKILGRIANALKISQAELYMYLFYLDSRKLPNK